MRELNSLKVSILTITVITINIFNDKISPFQSEAEAFDKDTSETDLRISNDVLNRSSKQLDQGSFFNEQDNFSHPSKCEFYIGILSLTGVNNLNLKEELCGLLH